MLSAYIPDNVELKNILINGEFNCGIFWKFPLKNSYSLIVKVILFQINF